MSLAWEGARLASYSGVMTTRGGWALLAGGVVLVAWGCGSRSDILMLQPSAAGDAGPSVGSGDSSGSSGGAQVPQCTPGPGLVTIASGQDDLASIAVGATYVYWTAGVGDGSGVMRASKCGGPVTTLASVDGSAGSLAVDARNVYFLRNDLRSSDADVMSVPIAGGAVVTLAAAPFAQALAIDATSAYWVTSPQDGTPDGTVMRLPLGGGAPETLASGQVAPAAVVVGGGNVYWSDRNGKTSMGYGGQVLAVPVGGGVPTVFGDQAERDLAMNSTAMFWEAEYVHWTGSGFDDDELIETEPLAGGTQVTLADASRGTTEFGPLVADESNLYYYAQLINNGPPIGIVKTPLAGGAPTNLTSGVGDPVFGIALDDTSLYWINGDGTVMRQTPK